MPPARLRRGSAGRWVFKPPAKSIEINAVSARQPAPNEIRPLRNELLSMGFTPTKTLRNGVRKPARSVRGRDVRLQSTGGHGGLHRQGQLGQRGTYENSCVPAGFAPLSR